MEANYFSHIVKVTFNEKKINIEKMREELGKEGFHIQGQPEYVD